MALIEEVGVDGAGPDMAPALAVIAGRESPSMATTIENEIGFAVDRAEGCFLWDERGQSYLDLTAGSGVHALGHGDPGLLAAMRAQLHRFTHGGWQVGCPARAELSTALAEALPWDDPVLLYCTTGSEAVEAALKVARAATGRRQVLGFLGGYHGKTAGSLSVTANAAFRRDVTEIPQAGLSLPYPAAEAFLPGGTVTPSPASSLSFGQDILEHPDFGLAGVAALMVEVVQGAGGMQASAPGLLRALREFTTRHGVLLVVDEIYTGFGRTGRMFGFEHEGVTPDLVVLGKAMGGGLPVSVVAGPRELMARIPSLRQTSTFSANPVACAAGAYVLRRIREERLVEGAARLGDALATAIGEIRVPGIRLAVRGRGLMIGVHVHEAPVTDRGSFTRMVVSEMRRRGVLVLRGGSDGSVIKLTPPLTMPIEAVEETVSTLRDSLAATLNDSRWDTLNDGRWDSQ